MHVGVIGGTGHISASIVRVLLAQGHAVTCVNRGLRGTVAPGARLGGLTGVRGRCSSVHSRRSASTR